MKKWILLTSALLLALAPLLARPPKPCSDLPTQWTLSDYYIDGTTWNGIRSDGGGTYKDGQSGVTAKVQICNNTNDAVLTTGSLRKLSYDFSRILAGNSKTPPWASGVLTGGSATLHVHNITFVPSGVDRAQEYSFTTRVGSILPIGSFGSWNLRMWKPVTDALSGDPVGNPYLAAANDPYIDSEVIIYHCPANSNATSGSCVGIVKETWFAYPTPSSTTYADGTAAPAYATQVMGLTGTEKNKPVNAGQFSMPFFLAISVQ
jgi:hypothetical protein